MKPLLRRAATLTAMATAAAAALTAVGAGPAFATAPSNDDFANAIALGVGPQSVNVTNATYQTAPIEEEVYKSNVSSSDPVYACFGGASRWYALPDPSVDGRLQITAAGGNFDGAIGVWTSPLATPNYSTLTGVGGLRPGVANQATLNVDLQPGQHYWLSVDTCNEHGGALLSSDYGTVTFAVGFVARWSNDSFASATPLTNGAAISADVTGASQETNEPAVWHSYLNSSTDPVYACYSGASRWYSVPAGAPALAITGATANFDGAIGLFSAAVPSPPLGSLTGAGGLRVLTANQSRLSVNLDPTLHYWIDVNNCNIDNPRGTQANVGTVGFTVSLAAPDVTAPAIGVIAPTDHAVFPQTATLNFSANVDDGAGSGIASVTFGIDGVTGSTHTIAGHGNGLYSQAIGVTNVAKGAYTFRITAVDLAGNTGSDSETIYLDGSLAGPTAGKVAAGSGKGVTTSGGVTKVKNKSGGGFGLKASKKGQKITILFVGSRIDLHFAATKIAGIASISIDGKVFKLDTYSKKAHDQLKALKNLQSGKHKVIITITGKKNSSSSGLSVLLTLFRVYA